MKIEPFASFVLLLLLAGAASAGVGFTRITVPDPMGGEMQVSMWYPAEAPSGEIRLGSFVFPGTRDAPLAKGRHALVVLSHGTSGSDLGHRNIAAALARRGIIAAAPLHPRDNYRDNSGVGDRVVFDGRPRQLHAVIDALIAAPRWSGHIDEARVGAFGFSLGGYTVLAAMGAMPDLDAIVAHCERAGDDPFCAIVEPLASRVRATSSTGEALVMSDTAASRLCAAAIVDPVGVPFAAEQILGLGIAHVRLWRPQNENVLKAEYHASRIAELLNRRDGFPRTLERVVAGAQHYSFIAPFPPSVAATLPPMLTKDAPGFDRRAFHETFATEVADYLTMSLAECAG